MSTQPPPATTAEKSAAFRWLQEKALIGPEERHAYVLLCELIELNIEVRRLRAAATPNIEGGIVPAEAATEATEQRSKKHEEDDSSHSGSDGTGRNGAGG